MDSTGYQQSDIKTANEHLGQIFYSSGRYNTVLLTIAGIGFMAIFLLTNIGIFGEPAPQLLYIGSFTLLLAIAQIPVLSLARQNQGIAANLVGTAFVGIYSVLLTLFWQGVVPVAIAIGLITPFTAFRNGMPRKYIPALILLSVSIVGIILAADANAPTNRLQNGTLAAIATIVFLIAMLLLIVTITFISLNRGFRTLQGLLLTSFIIIVTLATMMTAAVSAIGAYTNSQAQTFSTLEAIATLKLNQIGNLLRDSQNDTQVLQADPRFKTNVLKALSSTLLDENSKQVVRSRMLEVLGREEEVYSEIMVLDSHGNVMISTIPAREGTSFQGQTFFEQGILGFYAGFATDSSFGNENLTVATPILDSTGQGTPGVLVLRSNASVLKKIMESTPGFDQAETYFVDAQFHPVTRTRTSVEIVNTQAIADAIRNNGTGNRAIYQNYAGQQVLGYYQWFQPMQVAMLAEVPRSFVVNTSLHSLVGSALLSMYVVLVAIIAVAISARTITDPIQSLARTTESFAAGKLSARAVIDRKDEIGALADGYNHMAAQLQEMISRLEQRVVDRTHDLESQTLRLRVVAEIARDAVSVRDLRELLSKAAELILERFSYYHTGIFLLDNDNDYAVLAASPTEAGRKMIEENHKLRVGDMSIIGHVAATGEPRVILNTETDAVPFNNPFLPNTRSEMSLPLRVESKVIGVLDVQSDRRQAFTEEDIAIMQILADQLAIAIERTRLLQEVESHLKELESAQGRFTIEKWRRITANTLTGNMGYRFDRLRVEPISEFNELAQTVLKTGTTMSSNGSNHKANIEQQVAVPIKIRGKTIGVVHLKLKEGYDREILTVIELATERMASALESARLYEEARFRADREQSISRVTAAIGASTEYEQILQTTIKEIGSILDDTEVAIQILDEPVSGRRAERREG